MSVKSTRNLEISLSDEEYEQLYLKSYQAGLLPGELMEMFVRSLIDKDTQFEGAVRIGQWFSQLTKAQAIPELFHQYLAKQGKLVYFVTLCLKKEQAEARCEELRPRTHGEKDIADRESVSKEIEKDCALALECLDKMRKIYSEYKGENPKAKFSFEEAVQSAMNTYASMQTVITGEPYTFPDGSRLMNIQASTPYGPPDRITFDFQKNQITWKTPEKEGTDSFMCAREMRPLIFDILGEGEHDLSSLANFINIIAEDDVLAKRFCEAEMTRVTGETAGGENAFNGLLKTVEIKATVLERTYLSLKSMMKETDGTMGDVIDKLSVHFAPHEPTLAIHLATEELSLCLSGLGPAEIKKALIESSATLMSTMTTEEQNETYEKVTNIRRELAEQLKAMDKKGLKKLADALKQVLKPR